MFHCRVELYEGILSQLIAKAAQYEKSPTHLPYPKNITDHGAYVDIPAQSAAREATGFCDGAGAIVHRQRLQLRCFVQVGVDSFLSVAASDGI